MQFSNELSAKAKACKSAEEIQSLAKQHGVELSEKEAQEALARLNKNGELADSELNAVAGGTAEASCDTSGETPKYNVGDHVKYYDLKGVYMGAITEDSTGVIAKVSDKRQGDSRLEWLYTINIDNSSYTTEVYEHQITGLI